MSATRTRRRRSKNSAATREQRHRRACDAIAFITITASRSKDDAAILVGLIRIAGFQWRPWAATTLGAGRAHMRIPVTLATIAVMTMPAIAQPAPPSDEPMTLQQQIEQREKMEQERRDRAADIDKAYQRLQKSSGPATATKVDPWGNVRDANPTKRNDQSKTSK